ncbi:MAG: hypothetical protein AB7I22_21020 [Ramlibacter sp.]
MATKHLRRYSAMSLVELVRADLQNPQGSSLNQIKIAPRLSLLLLKWALLDPAVHLDTSRQPSGSAVRRWADGAGPFWLLG